MQFTAQQNTLNNNCGFKCYSILFNSLKINPIIRDSMAINYPTLTTD